MELGSAAVALKLIWLDRIMGKQMSARQKGNYNTYIENKYSERHNSRIISKYNK
jgi:hypothetical protein